MSIKMKGLLKGLRYISQIFEEEEEKEIQIGFPTDVKHVAHIGWDGPTTNAPSWMNEFKSPNEAPPGSTKENQEIKDHSSNQRSVRDSPARDLPALPKASRRQPSIDSTASDHSPPGSPTQKPKELKHSRRRHSKESKDATGGSRSSRQKEVSSPRSGESSSQSVPNVPKKSRRKKSKDGEGSAISSSRSKGHSSSARESTYGSEDGSSKSYSSDTYQSSGLASLQEEEVKG
ncbi:hypothetical protein Dimus_032630 [Dionaea muscipula]